jgi:sporulation protein YlmC with PRC-barrel domain
MAGTTEFTIGASVSCSDGPCGEVKRVVVDPVARAITHLVVEPAHRQGLGRLVPLDLVGLDVAGTAPGDTAPGEIRLRCTLADFEKLDPAEETQFIPGSSGYAAYGPEQVIAWPYYSLGADTGLPGGVDLQVANISPTITVDSVPAGEVAIRRGDPVHATDGDIGRVQGLVMNPRDHRVTHVLLQEGHLWGRKEVAIPVRAVTTVDDGIRLNISKRDVEDLPAVDIDHPPAVTERDVR